MEAEVRPPDPTQSTYANAPAQRPPSPQTIYRSITNYPWSDDSDYQEGLDAILAGVNGEEQQRSKEDTILQSKCFYFQMRYQLPDIDWRAYKSWLEEQTRDRVQVQPQAHAHTQSQPPSTSPPEPPYPTSFADIVTLITTGQPIPGIEQVPDTVLDVGASPPNKTPRRRKPWEKEGSHNSDAGDDAGVAGSGTDEREKVSEGGVVPLLQPLPAEIRAQEEAMKRDTHEGS